MVRFSNVYKTYENGTEALKDVSFRIDDGEFVFLVGPSGSGKSTITRLITAEVKATSGRIMVNGHNLNALRPRRVPELRRTLGVVFQDFRLIDKKTVWDNLAVVMRVVGASPRAIRRRIPAVLEQVGLRGKEKMYPAQLSGGEQQRVAIARALVNDPQMIIADEPTGNLDPDRSVEIMNLLREINERDTTMVVVTHERALVERMHKRVISISGGKILQDQSIGGYSYEQYREPSSGTDPADGADLAAGGDLLTGADPGAGGLFSAGGDFLWGAAAPAGASPQDAAPAEGPDVPPGT